MELFDILQYEYNKVTDVLDIPDAWTPINSLTFTPKHSGDKVFEYGLSVFASFPNISNSIMLRYRVDGSTWVELQSEPKDATDVRIFYYAFPKAIDNVESHTIEVEMMKEGGNDPLDVRFCELWIERKQ